MKVSVNWIKEYIDFELPPIDELVTRIGAQLGAVEEVNDLGAKYRGVIVAKVVSCEKHPNADKLSVCAIDDGGITPDVNRGEDGLVQVVCGAPNVREGLLVAWIPPKAIVPSTYDTDPFTLEARELRGIVSNGMLASGQELEINDDHSGILEIDVDVQPGQAFAEVYKLDDYIIEIENKMFTHRPDCFGQLGVAREIAGILGHAFTSPDWYSQVRKDIFDDYDSQPKKLVLVYNEIPDMVPRFMAISLSGITIKQSPIMVQSFLSRVGIRPINNVVDVTNYIMALTGQPLHAYDYDKVINLDYEHNPILERLDPEIEARKKSNAILTVRYPREGETIKLLNGKEITPRSEAIMIASKDHLIGIGGVMGGSETEVDENTKNIILECANFDMYSIRRTSMAHGLFTDAVTRFNKGQSPLQNDRVIAQATSMLQELAGGVLAGVNDWTEDTETLIGAKTNPSVEVSANFINARLGLDLTKEQICEILANVEFECDAENEIVRVVPPFWRTDIAIPEDVVEEVGRLHGFDTLPFELPLRTASPTQRNPLVEAKSEIREVLSSAGANEVSTYSFVHGDLLEKVGQSKELAFQISNALSPDLQYYRVSLTPSLLEKVHSNHKAGYDRFAIYEIGKAHVVGESDPWEETVPKEVNALSFVYSTQEKNDDSTAYYTAKKYLQHILDSFDVNYVSLEPLEGADLYNNPWVEQMVAPYEKSRSAILRDPEGLIWGVVGEFTNSVRKKLKLSEKTAGFELDPLLFVMHKKKGSSYRPLSRFPGITQDVTLSVPSTAPYIEVRRWAEQYLNNHKAPHTSIGVTDKDIYQKTSEDPRKHLTFSVSVVHYEKTLRETEVTQLVSGLADAANERYS